MTDPTGEILPAIIFGALFGGFTSYVAASAEHPEADFFSKEILEPVASGAAIGALGGGLGGVTSLGLKTVLSSARIAQSSSRLLQGTSALAKTVLRGRKGADILSGLVVGAFNGAVNEHQKPDDFGRLAFAASVVSGGIGGGVSTLADAGLAKTALLGKNGILREFGDEAVGAVVGTVANAGFTSLIGPPRPQPPAVGLSIK